MPGIRSTSMPRMSRMAKIAPAEIRLPERNRRLDHPSQYFQCPRLHRRTVMAPAAGMTQRGFAILQVPAIALREHVVVGVRRLPTELRAFAMSKYMDRPYMSEWYGPSGDSPSPALSRIIATAGAIGTETTRHPGARVAQSVQERLAHRAEVARRRSCRPPGPGRSPA